MVEIVAPCTMVEGFTFMATHDGESLPITVPRGGVQQGQVFSVRYPGQREVATEITPFFLHHTDEGSWKDDWWQCCRYGPCHVSLWNAMCCPQLLAAQILTRLQLNLWGNSDHRHHGKRTFRTMFLLVIVYWCLILALTFPLSYNVQADPVVLSPFTSFLYNLIAWGFGFYTWFLLTKLRAAVRARFKIPSSWWGEDTCMTLWCSCCSISQMARQTASYEQHSAICCSTTGIGAPLPYESVLTV
ncbi:hypothetical protein FisN_6Hh326 [Fistulifera solaris]|uniref:Uncharacterized protein n=1 Tax=Fistulifera solaris TaxID=1519565 RepID=A0A1Z5K802_FISSO|nr:hypothetical protein FisN_6Hh326 [Fistulifera solaris]|eukprot:GAX22078.1 hypothetical protein FisN_6Hh326 [Fistulifera solaris]